MNENPSCLAEIASTLKLVQENYVSYMYVRVCTRHCVHTCNKVCMSMCIVCVYSYSIINQHCVYTCNYVCYNLMNRYPSEHKVINRLVCTHHTPIPFGARVCNTCSSWYCHCCQHNNHTQLQFTSASCHIDRAVTHNVCQHELSVCQHSTGLHILASLS